MAILCCKSSVLRLIAVVVVLTSGTGIVAAPFKAYDKDQASLRFMVLGDWGGIPLYPYRTGVEKDVAARMGKVADSMDYKFVLGLGDNFYFDGVQNEFDKRFQETFEDVFTAKSLDIPWYFIAGNHDHNGNVTAQIEYSHRSKKWNFPSLYYSLNFTVPGTNTTVTIIQYDSITLCGNSDDFQHGLLTGPENLQVATTQLKWLEEQLNATKSDYVIVTAHYPVWSVAEHGPTKCLVQQVKPLLERYGVTAYFSGHDHNLQHLKEKDSDVEYFVIGCANFIDTSQKHKDSVPKDSLKFLWAEEKGQGGFAQVQVTEEAMTFTFLESVDGKELYQRVMKPRKLK
ncbi:ACP5 [Branchiostoma lanceolatum]|uniref:Tartrate-resistant acid phosphatase type 5 n=1 Tax=Branchiostoma lanceolatum TaxID=7740 RepID=A0A8J9Z7X6_BRALA|nr:ACP5 [Branchiostoma lanceolatum]